mgnify:CR=1 FL=1
MIPEREEAIMEVLKKEKRWMAPTDIGIAIGFKYVDASAKCHKSLERLIEQGLVEKTPKGVRAKYRIKDGNS